MILPNIERSKTTNLIPFSFIKLINSISLAAEVNICPVNTSRTLFIFPQCVGFRMICVFLSISLYFENIIKKTFSFPNTL